MVSAADDGDVLVVAIDDVGISNYRKSLGDGRFDEQMPLGQVSGFSYGNGLGDFDNDGDLDYVTATGYKSGSIHLFENMGPGINFADPVVIGTWSEGDYPANIVVSDFNADGNLDFILTHYGGTDCELYTGNGAENGTLEFAPSLLIDTSYLYSIGADAADFDNDGDADFIVAPYNYYSTEQLFYVNLKGEDGNFDTLEFESHESAQYWGVAAADFNGDEIVDLVATGFGLMDIYYGVGDGTFNWEIRIEDPNIYYYAPVDNYDFNGDEIQDIVIGNYGAQYPQKDPNVAVFFGDGEGRFTHTDLDTYRGGSSGFRFAITAPPFVPNTNDPPVAVVNPADQQITSGQAATFSADASHDEDGEIVSYTWDFGGQSATLTKQASEGPTAEHVFYKEGLHTVTLTVTDDKGDTSSATAQVQVTPMKVHARFTPKRYRLGTKGKWAWALIRLPRGYNASDIDPSSVCVVENNTPALYASSVRTVRKQKRNLRCKAKFNRQALLEIFDGTPGRKTVQIKGKLMQEGGPISFVGTTTLKATKKSIYKKNKKYKKKAKKRLEKKRTKLEKLMKKLAKMWYRWCKRHR